MAGHRHNLVVKHVRALEKATSLLLPEIVLAESLKMLFGDGIAQRAGDAPADFDGKHLPRLLRLQYAECNALRSVREKPALRNQF